MAGNVVPFQFRGTRNYLHSTTLMGELLPTDVSPQNLSLRMHRLTDRVCVFSRHKLPDSIHVASYRSDGCVWEVYETDESIRSSYPCNENDIIANTEFLDGTARFMHPPIPDADYMEAIVAAYKQILSLLGIDRGRKPVFAVVELRHIPKNGECRVVHRREIGDRFVESTLFAGEESIGRLYYGWQSPERLS